MIRVVLFAESMSRAPGVTLLRYLVPALAPPT